MGLVGFNGLRSTFFINDLRFLTNSSTRFFRIAFFLVCGRILVGLGYLQIRFDVLIVGIQYLCLPLGHEALIIFDHVLELVQFKRAQQRDTLLTIT